jgi:cytochrome c oxidase subunit 2
MLFSTFAYCDAAESWQRNFQDPATPVMEGIINLHNDIMFFLVVVLVFVLVIFAGLILRFENSKRQGALAAKFNSNHSVYFPLMTHHAPLEFIWTAVPALILVIIAIPSFALIYSMDDLVSAEFTLKVIGHQWYWTYEYGDILDEANPRGLSFDSYMIEESDLPEGAFRLLEVDNRVVLPIRTHIRVLVTSADVIHSWAVPSLGLKVDACPGRLNQVATYITRPGVFYGQCSEICGVNHGFMPIVVEAY